MEAEDKKDRTANYNVTSRQLNFCRVSLCCNEDSESRSGLVIRKLQTKVNEEGPEIACSLSHTNWYLPLSKPHYVRTRGAADAVWLLGCTLHNSEGTGLR